MNTFINVCTHYILIPANAQEGAKKQGKQWDLISNPRKALAKMMRESPRDPKPRMVFVDHLLEENDPRAQLIISKMKPRNFNIEERMQLETFEQEIRNEVMGDFPGVRVIEWDCDFPSCAYFQNQNDFARFLKSGNGDLLHDQGAILEFDPDLSTIRLIEEHGFRAIEPLEVLVPYQIHPFNPRSNLVSPPSGITMEEALEMGKNRIVASNFRLDLALFRDHEMNYLERGFWCWSGTMTAYEKPGMPFGDFVADINHRTGRRYLFIVPREYRGKSDCILVAEHPDFDLEVEGNDLIIHAKKVDVVENFPPCGGWYFADLKYGIPSGELVASSTDEDYMINPNPYTRFLWRNQERVGLCARGFANLLDGTLPGFLAPYIGLNFSPHEELGLIVKASSGSNGE